MAHDVRISPEPSPDDEQVLYAAVRELLRREDHNARPPTWRLGGWADGRTGLTDVARWLSGHRRWSLAGRLARGGRPFPGLNGRGDAK